MRRQTIRQVLLCIGLAIVLAMAWLPPLEETAHQQVDQGLQRAVTSFAVARALHSVLSAVQGTELSFEPFGVGVGFAPGQFLRPFNELVGQFADAMLAASVAFGAMKILITIGSFWMVSAFLSIVALAWVWFPLTGRTPPRWLSQIFLVVVLVRFAIPLVTVGSDFLFKQFMKTDYEKSKGVIEGTKDEAADLDPTTQLDTTTAEVSPKSGIRERIEGFRKRMETAVTRSLDLKGRIEAFNERVSKAADHIVRLIAVFLLQTLVIPLFLFWAICRVGAAMLDPRRWQT